MIALSEAADFLRRRDNFLILTHQYPDGDTLGSACGLCLALQEMGKAAKVLCSDEIPAKYQFLFSGIKNQEFKAQTIISVDVADAKLLGEALDCYKDKIDLCIDHHASNKHYAKRSYVDADAAAAAQIICELVDLLGIKMSADIAKCLYTGISTDTGCFKYSNTTAKTHQIAARLLGAGIDHANINRQMFDIKSKEKVALEKRVLETLEFDFGGRCAMICLTTAMIKESGAREDELEGFASIPRKIAGVLVGITIREKSDGVFKISIRSDERIDASNICARFEGGGHRCAAGCTISGELSEVRRKILAAVKEEMERHL